jgi:hypothetical protein
MMSETPGGPESLKLMELPSKPLGKGQVRVVEHHERPVAAHLEQERLPGGALGAHHQGRGRRREAERAGPARSSDHARPCARVGDAILSSVPGGGPGGPGGRGGRPRRVSCSKRCLPREA